MHLKNLKSLRDDMLKKGGLFQAFFLNIIKMNILFLCIFLTTCAKRKVLMH